MDYFPYIDTTITTGVCSSDTVTKFATRECQRELAAEPGFIYTTLNILMYDMCAPDEIPGPLDGLRKHPEHLCAVNLLSRPPGPAVLVGAAHCTYLCRSIAGNIVDNCCCGGPNDCSDDTARCGTRTYTW